MRDSVSSKALLPNGFSDLLPPEAGQEADAITNLLGTFKQFGYNRVKPPLVEFEEGLFAPGPGAALAQDTFRVMDPISHRMMGVRSDITAQIARISASRLGDLPRPLRLTYANDVLRTKGGQQRTARQFTQVGCEIIGPDEAQADIEICVVAISALSKLSLGPITIDINLPRLADMIFAEYDVGAEEQVAYNAALSDRDLEALQAIGSKATAVFVDILKASSTGDDVMDALMKLKLPKAVKPHMQRLQTVYDGVQTAINDMGISGVTLSVDVLETKGLEYHCGLSFGFFAQDGHAPLGRGGRYEILFAGEQAESATGFTFYMDMLRKAMGESAARDRVFVSANESWGVIQKLQQEGWITVRSTGHNEEFAGCTHKFENGVVKAIEIE